MSSARRLSLCERFCFWYWDGVQGHRGGIGGILCLVSFVFVIFLVGHLIIFEDKFRQGRRRNK